MDIDKSSMHVNVSDRSGNTRPNPIFKRNHQNRESQASFEQKKKMQRVNNIQNDKNNYAKTILEDDHIEDISDNEYGESSSQTSSKTSSIFLGE